MTTPSFHIGTAESLIDKSLGAVYTHFKFIDEKTLLHDIIKERRLEQKTLKSGGGDNSPKRGNRRPAHRQMVKGAVQNSQSQVKPTAVDKSIGKSKASRSAKIAAKRGLQKSDQPTPMEIEKEVYRQQRTSRIPKDKTLTGAAASANTPTSNPNRRIRRKKVNISSMRVEAGGGSGKKNPSTLMGKQLPTDRKPPKKAVDAAVMAMTKAGYQPPKGMKMEIRFVEQKK